MEILSLALRLAHVCFSFLWIGLALTLTLAVSPAALALALPERKAFQLQFLPRQMGLAAVGAMGTFFTGLLLLWQIYGAADGIGFAHDRGYWIILGSALGLGAFVIAYAIILPTGKKVLAILQGNGDPAQMGPLAAKLGKMAPVVTMHMLGAAVAMLAAAHGAVFTALNLAVVLGLGIGFGLAMLAFARRIKA